MSRAGTSPTTTAPAAAPSTVRSSPTRTLSWSTPGLASSAWPTPAPAPTAARDQTKWLEKSGLWFLYNFPYSVRPFYMRSISITHSSCKQFCRLVVPSHLQHRQHLWKGLLDFILLYQYVPAIACFAFLELFDLVSIYSFEIFFRNNNEFGP